MKKKVHFFLFLISLLLVAFPGNSQVLLSSCGGYYFQNFGTAAQASWTDNSTFLGWYMDDWTVYGGTINITNAAPTNTGGTYMYTINGGTDMKLGTRPSNASAGGPCVAPCTTADPAHREGVCLKNDLGGTITGIQLSFDWYQLSDADDGGVVNTNYVDYLISGANITNVNGGGYTGITSYSSAYVDGFGCCNQESGFPGTYITTAAPACFAVNIPVGSYIMFRWSDPNNQNNDPHFAIDNVAITFYADNLCTTYVLPVGLMNFVANREKNAVQVNWSTSSESNNNYFSIERSTGSSDGFTEIGKVQGAGNSDKTLYYAFTDDHAPGTQCFYRLKQTDFNGTSSYSTVVRVGPADYFSLEATYPNPARDQLNIQLKQEQEGAYLLEIMDARGVVVYTESRFIEGRNSLINLDLSSLFPGIYMLKVEGKGNHIRNKFVKE